VPLMCSTVRALPSAATPPLLADGSRRAQLGREGRRRAVRLYDYARVAAATRDVYDEVVLATGRAGQEAVSRRERGA
jgi:hypothetical protein